MLIKIGNQSKASCSLPVINLFQSIIRCFLTYQHDYVVGGGLVILLVFSGGPVDLTFAQSSDQIQVIFQCFFPGQATGEAIINVLHNLGPGANPAARLPYTWYSSLDQVSKAPISH